MSGALVRYYNGSVAAGAAAGRGAGCRGRSYRRPKRSGVFDWARLRPAYALRTRIGPWQPGPVRGSDWPQRPGPPEPDQVSRQEPGPRPPSPNVFRDPQVSSGAGSTLNEPPTCSPQASYVVVPGPAGFAGRGRPLERCRGPAAPTWRRTGSLRAAWPVRAAMAVRPALRHLPNPPHIAPASYSPGHSSAIPPQGSGTSGQGSCHHSQASAARGPRASPFCATRSSLPPRLRSANQC